MNLNIITLTHDDQNNLSYLLKKVIIDNNNILCINAAKIFGLTDSKSKNHQDSISHQLTPIINNILGFETFWDTGLPKGAAEFLVYGGAYSTKPVTRLDVSVCVGKASKQLSIFGDRIWTESEISEPMIFTTMPINYCNAFGGKSYELNPLGKGYATEIFTGMQLPNIELPNQLINSKSDKPDVAGFEPYSISHPYRNFSNPIDLTADIIKLETQVMPIHFNTAPIDQRLNGFFNGNETIEIKNMHHKMPIINSALPSIRFRAFAIQEETQSLTDMFLELETQTDTLWLLPNIDRGILIFRASCPISSIEANDIKHIYCAIEDLAEPPKPIQYYLERVLMISQLASDNQIPSKKVIATDNVLSINPDDRDHNPDNQQVDNEELILELIRNAQKNTVLNDDSNGQVNVMFGKLNDIINQFKITESDTKSFMKERQLAGLPPIPTEEEIIEDLREIWEKDPEIEAALHEKMQILKTLRAEIHKQKSIQNHL